MSDIKLHEVRFRIARDDAYETSIFDDPSSYSDVDGVRNATVAGLKDGSLAGMEVILERAVPGGWEVLETILTVDSSEFVGMVYAKVEHIHDEHIRDLAQSLLDEHPRGADNPYVVRALEQAASCTKQLAHSEDVATRAGKQPERSHAVKKHAAVLDGALLVLAQVMAVAGEDVIGWGDKPSVDRSQRLLEQWMREEETRKA